MGSNLAFLTPHCVPPLRQVAKQSFPMTGQIHIQPVQKRDKILLLVQKKTAFLENGFQEAQQFITVLPWSRLTFGHHFLVLPSKVTRMDKPSQTVSRIEFRPCERRSSTGTLLGQLQGSNRDTSSPVTATWIFDFRGLDRQHGDGFRLSRTILSDFWQSDDFF